MDRTIERDYAHLRAGNETVAKIDAAARAATAGTQKKEAVKKEQPPQFHRKWLGFFIIKKVWRQKDTPLAKVLVKAVREPIPDGDTYYFMLDETSGIIPRIRKNTTVPITRITFGDACSYLAE